MQSDLAANSAAAEDPVQPAYWLVWGREWPSGTDIAQAAIAVAPRLVPRGGLSYSAFEILGCADVYARKSGLRVIFFSDLTRQLARAGQFWSGLSVDWRAALREMQAGGRRFPSVTFAISQRAYLAICDPTPSTAINDRRRIRESMRCELESLPDGLDLTGGV